MMQVLDHGYIRLVETWGHGDTRSEHSTYRHSHTKKLRSLRGCDDPEAEEGSEGSGGAGIIEAARQSTAGAFRGWERDRKLLRYLWEHKHATPFEFAGAVIEVKAPIFVFREWQRHRTQAFNELSARYTEMPHEHYTPSDERISEAIERAKTSSNKQEQAHPNTGSLFHVATLSCGIVAQNNEAWNCYQRLLTSGLPRELARLVLPVAQYSQMRASANLRNWLAFLTLRQAPDAQWEIRQYANALNVLLTEAFPEVLALFNGSGSA